MNFPWTGAWGGKPIEYDLVRPIGDEVHYHTLTGFGWIKRPLVFALGPVETLSDGRQKVVWGGTTFTPRGVGPVVPYWFLVLLTAIVAAAVNVSWPVRFCLRGMMIAVAVVACLLALHVSLDR